MGALRPFIRTWCPSCPVRHPQGSLKMRRFQRPGGIGIDELVLSKVLGEMVLLRFSHGIRCSIFYSSQVFNACSRVFPRLLCLFLVFSFSPRLFMVFLGFSLCGALIPIHVLLRPTRKDNFPQFFLAG